MSIQVFLLNCFYRLNNFYKLTKSKNIIKFFLLDKCFKCIVFYLVMKTKNKYLDKSQHWLSLFEITGSFSFTS